MKLKINEFLTREDANMLSLRHMYSHHGFVHYKMNKFEEYDLYVENKDFLACDRIITFTDTDGKLMALKPDVTLSIIKNYKDIPGVVQKVYYNENVYRTSRNTKNYKEIMQMGLECIGDLDIYNISEVLTLAVNSLKVLSENYILDISHMGIVLGLMDAMKLTSREEKQMLTLLQEKNCNGVESFCNSKNIDYELSETAQMIASMYGPVKDVLKKINDRAVGEKMINSVQELKILLDTLDEDVLEHINMDFSIVNDMNYYNGFLFRGYIKEIPCGILSGGQYDEIMGKMGTNAKAIGFGINLELLEGQYDDMDEYDADILLLYDEKEDPKTVSQAVKSLVADGNIVQVQKRIPPKQKYKKIIKLENGGFLEIESDN